ncbi:hypothetical protein MPSEU_000280700 [Mayamaea pseudoterrestris]|nr:hypothetical protein MPSEU_000280700 [Mayamaea pseudoterrestris]
MELQSTLNLYKWKRKRRYLVNCAWRSLGIWQTIIAVMFLLGMSQRSTFFVKGFMIKSNFNQRHERASVLLTAVAARKASKKATKPTIVASDTTSLPYRLVIVESPSKCKTIDKILNEYVQTNNLAFSYQVTSCYGHVRDLSKEKIPPSDSAAFPYTVPGIDLSHHQFKPLYQIIEKKKHIVKELRQLASKAEKVLLATDPDREGEAIAWHLNEILQTDSIDDAGRLPTERVSFTEITPSAVLDAVIPTHENDAASSAEHSNLRRINPHLVTAQETRRLLDRLVGFTLSPILWRKIAPGLSAGRVQSVGMALVVNRERERLRFEATEYWDLEAKLLVATESHNEQSNSIKAKLVSVNGQYVASEGKDFTAQGRQLVSAEKLHLNVDEAHSLANKLSNATWVIKEVTSKQVRMQPPKPYRTSTLQQDANRRLSLSVDQTMRVAQQLYEAGYISYMRTDSSTLSSQAEEAIELSVEEVFGSTEYDASIRGKGIGHVKSSQNVSFAQEAHEAIRPAVQPGGILAAPELLMGQVDDVALKLYRMIYQRTLASRMQPLLTLRTRIAIETTEYGGVTAEFRATGSVIVKPGYSAAYAASKIDEEAEGDKQQLPHLKEGQVMTLETVLPIDHATQPPPRFNEASFVKELEALGVGRPSTYASTVKTLRERAYVGTPLKENSRRISFRKEPSGMSKVAQRAAGGEDFTGAAQGPLVPSLSAFVVSDLLEKHCSIIIDSGFTANMEEQLDWIASGDKPSEYSVQYLNDFYTGDEGLAARVKRIDEAVDADDARRVDLPALEPTDFASSGDDIALCVGPWGPFVKLVDNNDSSNATTVSLPPGMAADLTLISPEALRSIVATKLAGGLVLGQHPSDGRNIRLKTGRYGAFLQWGEDNEEGTTTHSLPKSIASMRTFDSFTDDVEADSEENAGLFAQRLGVTYDHAVGYVELPRTVCFLNDKPIVAAIGPYGPYLKYNNSYTSLKATDGDVLNVDPATAEQLVIERIVNGKPKGAIADLGEKDGSPVTVKRGRFGNYLNWKRVNAKLPSEYQDEPSSMPLEEAWVLIQAASGGSKGKKSTSKIAKSSPELPPAPKRPMSAYLHFCAAKRPEIKSTVSSLGDAAKALAALWAAASETERETYIKLAAAGKVEYEKTKENWQKECQEILDKSKAAKPTGKQRKIAVIKKAPPLLSKKAKSAYLFFCAEKRPQVAAQFSGLGAVTKELARQWAETSDRSKYEALAQVAKESHATENVLQT